MRWNDGRRSFTTHVNTNLRTISTNSKMKPAKLVMSAVQPALVSWGKVLTRFRDGAGLELTFKAKLVPEWSGVGRMEQSHVLAILGARGALDTKEMKALDDQATAGGFSGAVPGDRGACQAGTFADACQFAAACVCVARRGCPGSNATRRSLQVYASALLLCL